MILWGILRQKPHLRYRTGSETAAVPKNLSFKHEFLENPLLEYISFLGTKVWMCQNITMLWLNLKMPAKSRFNIVVLLFLCCSAVVHIAPDISGYSLLNFDTTFLTNALQLPLLCLACKHNVELVRTVEN